MSARDPPPLPHAPAPSPPRAEKPGIKGVTTPLDIATQISKGLAKKTVVAKVDGATWDLTRPLEGDCALQLLSFDDPEGKEVSKGAEGQGAAAWGSVRGCGRGGASAGAAAPPAPAT